MTRRPPAARPQPGFSVIELLIVVTIIAILIAIALPGYRDQVRKSRRVDAQSALLEAAQFMERYYTVNNSYTGAALPAAITSRVSAHYTLTLPAANLSATAFTVQAEPTGAQVGDACQTMTVTNTGARTAATSGCW